MGRPSSHAAQRGSGYPWSVPVVHAAPRLVRAVRLAMIRWRSSFRSLTSGGAGRSGPNGGIWLLLATLILEKSHRKGWVARRIDSVEPTRRHVHRRHRSPRSGSYRYVGCPLALPSRCTTTNMSANNPAIAGAALRGPPHAMSPVLARCAHAREAVPPAVTHAKSETRWTRVRKTTAGPRPQR